LSETLLQYDVAKLADRVAALEGRNEVWNERFRAADVRGEKSLALLGHVLEHAGSLQTEVLSALSRNEEELRATRRAVEEMARTQGDLIRQFSELAK
jgi:membrane-bound ClpP family serine protease